MRFPRAIHSDHWMIFARINKWKLGMMETLSPLLFYTDSVFNFGKGLFADAADIH